MSTEFVPMQVAELRWYQGLPFSVHYDDVYHSLAGGIDQSHHVFIEGNNLVKRWQNELRPQNIFTIAETGFGTGLNFLLAWSLWEKYAPKTSCLHFISCEKFPLTKADLIKALQAWPQLETYAKQLIKQYPILTPGNHYCSLANGRVKLTLMLGDALACYEQLLVCGDSIMEQQLRKSFVDAWFLDGFTPKKNKSMWSDELIRVISLLSTQGSTLATYTSAASVKQSLHQHGFRVEKKKGFGPKRHMISASWQEISQQKPVKKSTPWHLGISESPKKKSAVIVGAGLAGCFTAYSLARKGWQVELIDEVNEVASGASANEQAVLFPKLSAYHAPFTQFLLSAFLYATQCYQQFLEQRPLGELRGILLLAHNEKEQRAQADLQQWLTSYPQLGSLVSSTIASELAGIPLAHSGLFVPLSGWLNSPALCQYLIEAGNISLHQQQIKELAFDERWHVGNLSAEVLILANGYQVNSFKETQSLPVKPIRGQMTAVKGSDQSSGLKIPLCAEGHVLPAVEGIHHVGATYELKNIEAVIKTQDDLDNLNKLKQITDGKIWSNDICGHWAGIRATTPDYLPLVGQIPKREEFLATFAKLETNAKRWIPQAGPYYPGLYACAGFGSRGLTTIPLCAEWLASLINGEPSFLPRHLQQAISPARFLRKNIIRGVQTDSDDA